jgi:hypothetical protein
MFRTDPGPCPICGEAHSACTSSSGPITLAQLPARDALAATAQTVEPPAELLQPLAVAEPPPMPFSTAEYDRKKHGLKQPRRG